MARTRSQAKKIAQEYARSLAREFRVDGAVLFGSYARGEATRESDIDLIVLSRDFSAMPLMNRLQFLNRMRRGSALSVPMDILGFTPAEFRRFRKNESPNVRGLYKQARKVYP